MDNVPRVVCRSSAHAGQCPLQLTRLEAGWKFISFQIWDLHPGETVADHAVGEEVGLVLLSGRVSIRSGQDGWLDIGRRENVFGGAPYVLYLPPATAFSLTAETQCQIARAGVCASHGTPPYLITPDQIREEERGEGSARRHIRHLLEADRPAQRLFLVECITPGGNWSSYPPHKHDTDAYPDETYLEEIYYHRVRPSQGFGLQRVYTTDGSLNQTVVISDGVLVTVPAGYHPVTVAPGYELYYLNVMAGPVREWRFTDDPDHAWVASGWRAYGSTEEPTAKHHKEESPAGDGA